MKRQVVRSNIADVLADSSVGSEPRAGPASRVFGHLWLAAVLLVSPASALMGADVCEVCGGRFVGSIQYTRMDQWTRQPASPVRPPPRLAHPPPSAPEVLTLMGLIRGKGSIHSAMINGKLLSTGETSAVPLGTNLVTVSCTEIGPTYVVLELVDSGESVRLEWSNDVIKPGIPGLRGQGPKAQE
jgi:hypothetical protein